MGVAHSVSIFARSLYRSNPTISSLLKREFDETIAIKLEIAQLCIGYGFFFY
jgi:hypothetical protein